MDDTSKRTDIDGMLDREEAGESERAHGHRIPGRDFAGASFAADQREQTGDRRGDSRAHTMDDVAAGVPDETASPAPRDES